MELTCEAEGIPEPNITWYKDGKLLPREISNSLIITEVELTDRGSYRCHATNFDPYQPISTAETFTDISEEAIININGMIAYYGADNNVYMYNAYVASPCYNSSSNNYS